MKATQRSTLGYNVALMPLDGLTRERIMRVVDACLNAIEEQAQDQEYDIIWPSLTIRSDETATDLTDLQGSLAVVVEHRSLSVTVDAVREVEVEDE